MRRGRKWSEEHGVPYCSAGFGFCIVDGGVSPFPLRKIQTNLPDEHYPVRFQFSKNLEQGNNKGMIVFGENVPHAEPVFFGEDEDTLYFPTFISNMYEVKNLALLPGNYTFEVSEEYPYGYVRANFYVEK